MDNARSRRRAFQSDAFDISRVARVQAMWTALRPRQWVKNLLVLAPVLFSQNLFNAASSTRGLYAFALFCLMSSSGYLINDIRDLEQDRLHPVKCARPLAAGGLGARAAMLVAVALCLSALAGALALGSPAFTLALAAYWLVNLLYSFSFKHFVILDVFSIACGFLLRVAAGALVIGVEISSWLFVCTTLLALFLGFSKRRHELLLLKAAAGGHRQVLEEYNPLFLDMMIGIVAASTVTSYTLYTISEQTNQRFHTRGLLITLPFMLYGIFRYLYLIYHKERGGDPLETAMADRATVVNLLLWTAAVILVLYGR